MLSTRRLFPHCTLSQKLSVSEPCKPRIHRKFAVSQGPIVPTLHTPPIPLDTIQLALMKAIILAAGLGTRLRPLTLTTPKCLVPINGVPSLELWLGDCERAGIEAVLVNTHHLAERVEEFVAARHGIPVTLAYESTLLPIAGTSGELGFCGRRRFVRGRIRRQLATFPLSDLIAFHATHDRLASMALFRSPNPSACGVVEMDSNSLVTGFWEKSEKLAGQSGECRVVCFSPRRTALSAYGGAGRRWQVFDAGAGGTSQRVAHPRLLRGYRYARELQPRAGGLRRRLQRSRES